MMNNIEKTLPGVTDYAVLAPNLTNADFQAELIRAAKLHAFSVCVRPSDVKKAVHVLHEVNDYDYVAVGTVVGFPHGSSTIEAKAFETVEAVNCSAAEIDYVMNISEAIDGNYGYLIREAEAIRQAAGHDVIVKVILETAFFTPEQIVDIGSRLAASGSVDFLKTSTGFASEGATRASVEALLKAVEGTPVQVKASGGINSLEMAAEYAEMGVTRFGTSKLGRFADSTITY